MRAESLPDLVTIATRLGVQNGAMY
jgi:hypothetical protein